MPVAHRVFAGLFISSQHAPRVLAVRSGLFVTSSPLKRYYLVLACGLQSSLVFIQGHKPREMCEGKIEYYLVCFSKCVPTIFFCTPRLALRAGSMLNHRKSFPLKDDSCRSGLDKGFPSFRHQKLQIRPSSSTSSSCSIVMLSTIICSCPTEATSPLSEVLQPVQAKPVRSPFYKGKNLEAR